MQVLRCVQVGGRVGQGHVAVRPVLMPLQGGHIVDVGGGRVVIVVGEAVLLLIAGGALAVRHSRRFDGSNQGFKAHSLKAFSLYVYTLNECYSAEEEEKSQRFARDLNCVRVYDQLSVNLFHSLFLFFSLRPSSCCGLCCSSTSTILYCIKVCKKKPLMPRERPHPHVEAGAHARVHARRSGLLQGILRRCLPMHGDTWNRYVA